MRKSGGLVAKKSGAEVVCVDFCRYVCKKW